MKPENVNPSNFKVDKILYNNNSFSIALGIWEDDKKVLAMRWNGDINDENDKGYPKTFGNPMWFIVDDEIKIPIIKSILSIKNSYDKNILETLSELI